MKTEVVERAKRNRVAHKAIEEAEALCPPIAAIEAKRRSLLLAYHQGFTAEGSTDIARKLEEMAKGGDIKAMKLHAAIIQTMHEQPAREFVYEGPANSVSELRRHIVYCLAECGPMAALEIAESIGRSLELVIKAIDGHDWFDYEGKRWVATEEAKAQVAVKAA